MSLTANGSVRRGGRWGEGETNGKNEQQKTKSQTVANLALGRQRKLTLSRHIEVLCGSLRHRSVSVGKDKGAKQKGQSGRVCASEFRALLPPYIAPRITNLGGVIPASRRYFKATFQANHPVMLLLIANEGSDGR